MRPHPRVRILRPHRDDLRLIGLRYDLVVLYFQVHLPLGKVTAVAAGIQEAAGIVRLHVVSVVVAGQDPVDPLHHTEGVQAFGLQDAAVPGSRTGVHRHDHHVRTLLGADPVHILLDHVHDRLEMHPAPEALREPSLHIGIGIAQDSHLQPSFPNDLVRLEIRLPVVVPDGIGGQEIHPVLP